jgi:hypothetical protein
MQRSEDADNLEEDPQHSQEGYADGDGEHAGGEMTLFPVAPVQLVGHALKGGNDLLEALVHLFKTFVDLLEAAVHLAFQALLAFSEMVDPVIEFRSSS